jgi:hypothetical protein
MMITGRVVERELSVLDEGKEKWYSTLPLATATRPSYFSDALSTALRLNSSAGTVSDYYNSRLSEM